MALLRAGHHYVSPVWGLGGSWWKPSWAIKTSLLFILFLITFFSNLFGFLSVLLIKKWFTEIVLVYLPMGL
jgi:hypothetical protein